MLLKIGTGNKTKEFLKNDHSRSMVSPWSGGPVEELDSCRERNLG